MTQRLGTGRGYALSVSVRQPQKVAGTSMVVLCHGLGVSSQYPLITTLAASLLKAKYPVCTFDFAGHGKSGGRIKDRLLGNFIADIGSVLSYLRKVHADNGQPVVLIGHSIGAVATVLYAGAHPREHLILIPIAANARANAKYVTMAQRGQVKEHASYAVVGRSHVAKRFWLDRIHFEPKKFVPHIICPVLYLCGTEDHTNPPEESRLLYDWTRSSEKKLRMIPDADHHFKPIAHQRAVAKIVLSWLQEKT